ncbi:hypothetical protein [Lactococcus petauri]|uniref:hypothetical protein n=1 Tax=Lactococcus petauri TaxID=1940789 RepID=UPI00254A9F5E|nr:hypothetical protein [Lactococcus petauri]
MLAKYNGNIVEVWEISKANEQPDWIKKSFEENYLTWLDDRLKILLNGIKPNFKRNFKLGVQGILGTGDGFGGAFVMGDIGDYLDITTGQVVSSKYFSKHYKLISGEL